MKRFLPLALLAATILVAGCGGDDNPEGPKTTGDVAGKILNDFDNTPVAGVTLKIQESTETTTSDASGSYSLKNIKPGSYHLIASKDGFDTQFDDITITVGTTLSHDVYISPPMPEGKGKISGRVYDEDGNPVAGVTVKTSPATKTAVTDANGVYRLVPIDQEFYDVIATKPGMRPDTMIGDLRFTDLADSVNFTLRDSISKKGLTALFSLAGNANDPAHGLNGTLQGAVGTTDRFGTANGALSFNGDGAAAKINSTDALNLGGAGTSFTISYWMKATSPQTRYAGIITKGEENSFGQLTKSGYHFTIEQNQSSQLLVSFGFKAASKVYTSAGGPGSDVFDGRWHMLTFVYDRQGKRIRMFKDGEAYFPIPLEANEAAYDFSTTEPLYLGRSSDGTKFFKGGLDDLRIYSRALEDDEVEMLYHEGGYE